MNKTRCIFFPILITLFLLPVSIFAFDFGLITNQYAGFGNMAGEEDYLKYQADFLPRLSFLIGDTGEFYLSGGMSLGYEKGEEKGVFYVPELLRTEISLRFGNSGIRAGRMNYNDPLSFVVNGLFDGARFSHYSKAGVFSIGAWYTGLIYKKSANIFMTKKEQEAYNADLEYKADEFSKTYFAPRRLLASLDWEHPSIAEAFSLKAAITGQIDLSNEEEDKKYHSQYFILKAGIPVKSFLFEIGGSLETAQTPDDEAKNSIAFAWDLGLFWTLPTSFTSRLSLTGSFAGGAVEDSKISAFVPVTTKFYGSVLQAKLSGLTVLDLNYTARISRKFGTSFSFLYFICNDLGTYSGYPVRSKDDEGKENENYSLGAELFAKLTWSPVSDLQLNLGGGAFIPAMGNVSDDMYQWRLELTAILALY